jgi:hypothetical protein
VPGRVGFVRPLVGLDGLDGGENLRVCLYEGQLML